MGEGGSTMESASHGAHPVLFPSPALNLTAQGVGISVVRVKVMVKVIDLQTSSQRDLSYMALT